NVIKDENPDIMCFQEFSDIGENQFGQFKYSYLYYVDNRKSLGQAIFSKYPIINKGVIEFEDSSNHIIFADIVKKNDTLRVYSMHLQSMSITRDVEEIDSDLDKQKSERIIKKISEAFSEQQQQATELAEHQDNCHYPIIICGDMNNSAFSYVYRVVKGNLNDAFEEAGGGFGKSYRFKYFPMRIDYI